jgi:dienelactone hydrolase
MADPDPLDDFARGEFTHEGVTHPTFRKGQGPAVIVISEMPGITPAVADFARRVVDLGCTVVMPSLFGIPGRPISVPYVIRSITTGCVSKEFHAMALGQASPVTVWLRALARELHAELGGPGVGAVGMCFTGGFALAMMVDDETVAPVLSQPSLPFAIGAARKAALGLSDDDLQRVKQRVADGVCLLGLRFTGDSFVPAERFQRLRDELGDGFVAVEIDSSKGNAYGIPKNAHSVLTEHLVDEPGHPTRDALDQVLELFRTRLLTSGT